MKVVFCGGGTGGHVYPALTVASALKRLAPSDLEILYIGVKGKIDADLVGRERIPFKAVTAAPLRTASAPNSARGGLKTIAGMTQAYSILGRFKPDAVFATGGYGSVGVALAAKVRKIPVLLFEPGPEAGMAVKLLSQMADRIAVTIPPALSHMPRSKTSLTGYPVRRAFFEASRDEARKRLGLQLDMPVLLVSGASSGASKLNDAVISLAPDVLRTAQLLHLSGLNDETRVRGERAKLPPDLQQRYHLHAYLHDEMPLALAAADLAVMRSGGSVLGELPATCLPAVLVPGEYEGWDQSPNARYLEEQGAAVMLPQSRIDELPAVVKGLLSDEPRRRRMKEELGRLAQPDADERLARILLAMAGVKEQAAA
jgi:UDP-N-acetylglucosamine--N-acetylmuramyl-(pentapeptide) pyrophosphoryl-undecaprenol N-acetylglucosamine transferase